MRSPARRLRFERSRAERRTVRSRGAASETIPPDMRTLAIALALFASASVAGCGGGGSPARRSATGARGHAPSPRALSRKRGLAFARAVNLTAADLPEFRVSHEHAHKTPAQRQAERDLLRCAGSATRGAHAAEASSPSLVFKRGLIDFGVSSEVLVSASPSRANGELAALHTARVRHCFSRYLDVLLRTQRLGNATIGPVSIQSGNPPAPGTSGSFGWRVTATFRLVSVRVPFYLDLLGFVLGPARVTLISSGALRPFPAAIQQRLYTLLLARAREHAL